MRFSRQVEGAEFEESHGLVRMDAEIIPKWFSSSPASPLEDRFVLMIGASYALHSPSKFDSKLSAQAFGARQREACRQPSKQPRVLRSASKFLWTKNANR